ncbi:hypothetical protein HL653_22275 [Sphingomonas sp. AP4-R1]|uniref:hypothetical protein n=1 Tax=Sphingomonas sp. AP4-R1 TaxID=2735134 RepID=UPI0014939B0C|nr:hypothetical protein [Sphingomonas sp. AP4-R1]QJU60098.1 hypothetical protein HL653_22275 [Sphingomonas sp. AP4-R1]
MTAALFATYPRDGGGRFDREDYVASQLPLVVKASRQYGLSSAEAYFSAGEGAPKRRWRC